MATVEHYWYVWVSAEGGDLAPGASEHWRSARVAYGSTYSMTAYPITGNPLEPDQRLGVENIYVIGEPDGTINLEWDVKSVGSSYIVGYFVDIGRIGP